MEGREYGRKEGRMEGREHGRKEGRMERREYGRKGAWREGKENGRKEGRMEGRKGEWKESSMEGRKGEWKERRENGRKEGRMEGREHGRKGEWKEWRKAGRKERLAIWLLDIFIVWCLKQAQKVRLLSFRVLILILPPVKKKNFWGNIVSSACKELELPIASRLHGEGHGFDFQNFSHANPYVIWRATCVTQCSGQNYLNRVAINLQNWFLLYFLCL